jgi:hypothetical protein
MIYCGGKQQQQQQPKVYSEQK